MQIAIVVGSHRKESQSSRVGAYIASDLARTRRERSHGCGR